MPSIRRIDVGKLFLSEEPLRSVYWATIRAVELRTQLRRATKQIARKTATEGAETELGPVVLLTKGESIASGVAFEVYLTVVAVLLETWERSRIDSRVVAPLLEDPRRAAIKKFRNDVVHGHVINRSALEREYGDLLAYADAAVGLIWDALHPVR